jgi:hypothetical protein
LVSVFMASAGATTTDHYQCYAVVKGSTIEPIALNLKDQFGRSRATAVRAVSVCAPVNKNGSKIDDTVTHLVCYQLQSDVTDVGKTVRVTNQFGDLRVNGYCALRSLHQEGDLATAVITSRLRFAPLAAGESWRLSIRETPLARLRPFANHLRRPVLSLNDETIETLGPGIALADAPDLSPESFLV